MSGVNKWTEEAVKQGKKKGADMRAVNIGISGNNYLVVSEFRNIKCVPYRRAESDDQIFDLLGSEHLVEAGAVYILKFSPPREEGLFWAIPAPPWPCHRRNLPRQ